MCLSGAKGFTSVILDTSKFDKKSFEEYPNDQVYSELVEISRTKETTLENWIFTFLVETEKDLVPVVKRLYKSSTSESVSFKSSVKKLNVKHPREDKSRDSESNPSQTGKDSETTATKEPAKKSKKEPLPKKKTVTAKAKPSKKPLELTVQKVCLLNFLLNYYVMIWNCSLCKLSTSLN